MDEWKDYIEEKAAEYGVDIQTAQIIFDMLGPSEAYDGFLIELEDASLEG